MVKQRKSAVTPKLRFPEFWGYQGWEFTPLESIAERVSTKNTDGEVVRVLTNSAERGVLDQRDYFDRDIATAGKVDGYYIVDAGDYVYNPRTSATAPVGPISRNNIGKGVMSPLYTVFRFAAEKTDFYEHFFKSTGWHTYVRSVASTGARHDRMSITTGAFMQMPVPTPDETEQKKIADCLSSLDELIAAQGRKVDALKIYKRGLMQQLFPHEGETLPRLRFPEFRNAPEWTEERLGKHVDIWSGNSPSTFGLSSSGRYPYVKVEDLNNCTKYQTTGREFCDDARGLVPEGSLLFPKRGAAIELNKIRITESQIQIDTNLMAITPKEGLTAEFLFYCISNVGLAHIADTSTIPQINNKHLIPFVVRFPSVAEQQQIADALSALDVLIASEVEKLDSFKTHKKGLMQQLFPSPEKA